MENEKNKSDNSQNNSQGNLPSIAVIGAGALGSFYGALLQKAGHTVEYQSKSAFETLSHSPLNIKSIWGDFDIKANFFENSEKMTKADIVLVTCKALPEVDYKNLLQPVVDKNTIIVVLQNGINNDENIQDLFRENEIYAATAFTCINRLAPDRVHHLDYGNIVLASTKQSSPDKAIELSHYFTNAGIPTKTADDHRKMRWQKLLWNIPFNSLSVLLHGATTSEMISNENCLNIVRDLLSETRGIAESENISFSIEDSEKLIERTKRMKPYKTSMLLDHESKKPMEVETILGEPL